MKDRTKLIHTGHDHFVMSFSYRQFFYTPTFAGKLIRRFAFVGRDHPIGTYHAIIAIFFTKQVGHYVLTEPIAHIFVVGFILVIEMV